MISSFWCDRPPLLNLPPSPHIQFPTRETIISTLLKHVPAAKQDTLCDFLIRLYAVYVDLHCE